MFSSLENKMFSSLENVLWLNSTLQDQDSKNLPGGEALPRGITSLHSSELKIVPFSLYTQTLNVFKKSFKNMWQKPKFFSPAL